MKSLIAIAALCLAACGPAPSCSRPYPNATPEGLCCDASWALCLDATGRVVGAP